VSGFESIRKVVRRRLASAQREQGVITPVVALSMTSLLCFGAIAIDGGNARQVKRQAQSTADAAALAGLGDLTGARVVDNEQAAVGTVKRYALVNQGIPLAAWTDCDTALTVPAGWSAPDNSGAPGYTNRNNCILIDSNNTRLRITHLPAVSVETFLGQIAGINEIMVTARATASILPGGGGSCGLCVLGDGIPYVGGNGDLTISGDSGAGVAINGGGSTSSNGSLNVVSTGAISLYNNGTFSGNVSPTPRTFHYPFADPLAGLALPSMSGPVKTGCSGPGVYRSIPTECGTLTGLYVITGQTHISGDITIRANNATFYLTCEGSGGIARSCNPGESGADLVCTGRSSISINAPSSGTTKGLAVLFDRNNAGILDCRGNGGAGVTGTVYGASASLVMRGNGNCNLNSLVVVAGVQFDGNSGSCSIVYTDGQNVDVPMSPASLTSDD